jgi:hypothetical protein
MATRQPDLFASGAFVRAADAPGPGQQWPQQQRGATVTVNATDYILRELSRARELNVSGMFGALDNKRPRAWEQYGYPDTLTFQALLSAYERGGAAHGAVHRILDKCWQTLPRIKQREADEETPWEASVAKVFRGAKVWRALRDLDRRNMVGRYAAVIYRVADGRPLREPLVRARSLVGLVPVYEDQLKVAKWDSDNESPTYGQPTMFQYQSRPPGQQDTQGKPVEWADVHPSRVQILAEGSVGDFFDGVPLLRAGFNALIDLEKVAGGSGESFLKNSARTITFKYDANSDIQRIAANPGEALPSGTDIKSAIELKGRDLNRNIDTTVVTQGGEVGTLQTTVADPEPSFQVAANLFAASVQIPFTILFGQQTGRLASDEDRKDFHERCASRRANDLTPLLEEFVQRMQAAGIIEQGEFEVEWEPLDSPGDADKAELLGKMTAAMQQASSAGLSEPLFDANELRGVMDYERRVDDGMPAEGDLTPEEQAAADAAAAVAAAAGQRAPVPKPALRAAA